MPLHESLCHPYKWNQARIKVWSTQVVTISLKDWCSCLLILAVQKGDKKRLGFIQESHCFYNSFCDFWVFNFWFLSSSNLHPQVLFNTLVMVLFQSRLLMSCAKGHQAKQKGMGDLSPGLTHKVSIYIFQPRNFRKFVFTLQRQQCLLTYRTGEKKKRKRKEDGHLSYKLCHLWNKLKSDNLIYTTWEAWFWPSLQLVQLFFICTEQRNSIKKVVIKPGISGRLAFPPDNCTYVFSKVAYFKAKHCLWFHKGLYYGGSFVCKHLQLIAGNPSERSVKAKEPGTSDLHFKDFPININSNILLLIPLSLIEV